MEQHPSKGKTPLVLPSQLPPTSDDASLAVFFEGEPRLFLPSAQFPRKSPRYTVVNADGSPAAGTVTAVGAGGFGVVVRARDTIGVHRAIKFVAPDPSPNWQERVAHEIMLTSHQPYRGILPISDHGELLDAIPHVYFFASPYVDGPTLALFFGKLRAVTSSAIGDESVRAWVHDTTLRILRDVLSAFVELELSGVIHVDFKPSNCLVYPAPPAIPAGSSTRDAYKILAPIEFRGIVIDLGGGKFVKGDLKGRTLLAHTPYFFPEHIKPAIAYDERDFTADRAALAEFADFIDLYCIGRSLESIFLDRVRRQSVRFTPDAGLRNAESEKESYWQSVFGSDFSLLDGLVDGLLDPSLYQIRSAREALLRFEALPLRTSRNILESAPLLDRESRLHINVGRQTIGVGHPFAAIVDHPSFQRLRRIQQLAFTSEVFPEATHTRFTHSLRVFALAKRVVLSLLRRPVFRLLLQRSDIERLLAAALLHDVGQYPFSKTIEDLKKMGDKTEDEALAAIQHDQDLAQRFCDFKDPGGVSIADLLRAAEIEPEEVYAIISKTDQKHLTDQVRVAKDLITGIADLDRVSYLLHDSERTGVPYGSAVDVDAFVEALTVRFDPTAPAGQRAHIAIQETGLSAVEAVVTAVYWMYRNVYWNAHNRRFMAALKYVVSRLLRRKAITFDDYLASSFGRSDWEALRWLSDKFDDLRKNGLDSHNPLSDLVDLQRLRYGRLFSLSRQGGDVAFFDSLVTGISAKREETLVEAAARHFETENGTILLDIPLKRRLHALQANGLKQETAREAALSRTLYVELRNVDGGSEFTPLEDASLLARTLSSVEDFNGRKIRVFAHADVLNRVRKHGRRPGEEMKAILWAHLAQWRAEDEANVKTDS